VSEQREIPAARLLRSPPAKGVSDVIPRVQARAEWAWRSAAVWWLVLAGLLLGGGVFLYRQTRGSNFWFDEWEWILHRRGGSIASFLDPHNQHLSLIPVTIYKILFSTAGLGDYRPYRVLVTLCHLLVVALLFVYARRRIPPPMALLCSLLLLFFGPGWQNFLWPFQLAWLISLAAGLVALLMLDRRDLTGSVVAAVMIGVSLASSGIGVPITIGVVIEMLLRRAPRRELLILAIPIALYIIWWIGYQQAGFARHAVVLTPEFTANEAAATVAALLGLGGQIRPAQFGFTGTLLDWGRPLAVLALIGLGWRVWRGGGPRPRLVGLLVMLASLWILTALSRSGGLLPDPTSSRYLYVGAVLVLLVIVELVASARWRAWAWAVATVIGVGAAISNFGGLRDGARYLRQQGSQTTAALAALDISRGTGPDSAVASQLPGYPLIVVPARQYFATAHDLGSAVATPSNMSTLPEPARVSADAELVNIYHLAFVPAQLGADGCQLVKRQPYTATGSASPGVAVTVPATGVSVTVSNGDANVGIRRFGDEYQPLGSIASGSTVALRVPIDSSAQPWRVSIQPQGRATVCAGARRASRPAHR
jgi:hypothetical protein